MFRSTVRNHYDFSLSKVPFTKVANKNNLEKNNEKQQ